MLALLDRVAGAWLDWRTDRTIKRRRDLQRFIKPPQDSNEVAVLAPAVAILADQATTLLTAKNVKNFVQFEMIPRADRGLRPIWVTVAWANGEMPAAKCARLEEQQQALLHGMWDLLDAIIAQNGGDTLWAGDAITAHERLVELAADVDPQVAEMFQEWLETGDKELSNE